MVGGRELMRSRELTLPKPFFPFVPTQHIMCAFLRTARACKIVGAGSRDSNGVLGVVVYNPTI